MDKKLYFFQNWRWTVGLTQPPFQWVQGSFVTVKWPGCAVNHSSLSSAEDKNEWSYISSPPAWLRSVDKENFTFLLSGLTCLKIHWYLSALHTALKMGKQIIASAPCTFHMIHIFQNLWDVLIYTLEVFKKSKNHYSACIKQADI